MINKPKTYCFGINQSVFHSSSVISGTTSMNMSIENNIGVSFAKQFQRDLHSGLMIFLLLSMVQGSICRFRNKVIMT